MGRVRTANRSGSRALTAAVLLLAAGGLAAQQPETAVFRTDVRLVTFPVTVKDARGAPLGDLERSDFRILEEGVPHEVAVFERRTNQPVSVALMLDASLSTAIELRYERQSAARFLASLLGRGSQPADNAAVFAFSSGVVALSPFTRNHGKLEKALDRVRPETGTSLYAAVVLASDALARREGRRVIVLITDGGDTTSRLRFADALRSAHASESAIYALIVLPIRSDAGRNRGGEHALITLAKNTGGEAFIQHGADNLDEAFSQILRNLRTQYLLGYYPHDDQTATGEDFRKVEIRVAREGAVVLARSGYFASAGTPPPTRLRSRRPAVRLRPMPKTKSSREVGAPAEGRRAEEPPRRPPEGRPRPPIVRPQP